MECLEAEVVILHAQQVPEVTRQLPMECLEAEVVGYIILHAQQVPEDMGEVTQGLEEEVMESEK
jgi:hypothetical protein